MEQEQPNEPENMMLYDPGYIKGAYAALKLYIQEVERATDHQIYNFMLADQGIIPQWVESWLEVLFVENYILRKGTVCIFMGEKEGKDTKK